MYEVSRLGEKGSRSFRKEEDPEFDCTQLKSDPKDRNHVLCDWARGHVAVDGSGWT